MAALIGGALCTAVLLNSHKTDLERVTVLGMGGTIDKDYPRSQMGYAFEIDEPAAQRVLEGLPHSGIKFDVESICKKDSTEITNKDRDELVAAVRRQ